MEREPTKPRRVWVWIDGEWRQISAQAAARNIYGLYAHLAPSTGRVSEELIAERRAEAARE